jgi:hypothetical protein
MSDSVIEIGADPPRLLDERLASSGFDQALRAAMVKRYKESSKR